MEEHKNNALVFADGKLVTPNALTSAFEKFINKHNLKHIRLHDLRHSCASILYANGTDLLTIQEVLGSGAGDRIDCLGCASYGVAADKTGGQRQSTGLVRVLSRMFSLFRM